MRNEYPEYAKAGALVVVIGQGEPQRARDYARKYHIPCPILCDPGFKAYEAYGLREGGPVEIPYDAPEDLLRCEFQAGVNLQKARREAGRNAVDSPWQLPGEFVVGLDGTIRFAYRYQYCDNYPDPRVLVAAIKTSI